MRDKVCDTCGHDNTHYMGEERLCCSGCPGSPIGTVCMDRRTPAPAKRVPNPGSDAALDAGCRCAVLDNAHGRGAWTTDIDWGKGGVFWISEDCPLHAGPIKRKAEKPRPVVTL